MRIYIGSLCKIAIKENIMMMQWMQKGLANQSHELTQQNFHYPDQVVYTPSVPQYKNTLRRRAYS